MFRKLFVFLFVITFLSSCLTRVSKQEQNQYVPVSQQILDTICTAKPQFSSILVNKSTARLEYEGELRTLSSRFYLKLDSILIVELHTAFKKNLSLFCFLKDSVRFHHFPNKVTYTLSYNFLSEAVGLPISFDLISSIFSSTFSVNPFEVDYNSSSCSVLSNGSYVIARFLFSQSFSSFSKNLTSLSFKHNIANSFVEEYCVKTNLGLEAFLFKSAYDINKPYYPLKNLSLDFLFDSQNVGFDLFIKSFQLNSPTFDIQEPKFTVVELKREYESN